MGVGSFMWQLERLTRRLREGPVVATIVVTALTIVLVGGVILTTTSVGCGPAKALGLKGITARCTTALTAARPSPSPSQYTVPTPTESQNPFPVVPTPPAVPPASAPNPPTGGSGSPAYPVVIESSGGTGPVMSALNCRLPAYVGPPGSGGFIVFPSDMFIPDPASSVTVPSPSPGNPTPSPAPGYFGPGQTGLSYDSAYARWLPAPLQAVSADGARYAYAPADGIYVVTVGSGAVIELGKGHAWSVLSVGTAGVYATIPNAAGLWLLPLSGTPPQQISTTGYWQAVGGGAAYGTPTSAVPQGTANTIQRMDLATGAITNYFTRPGSQSQVSGFDAQGVPVIYLNGPAGNEVWIGTGLFLMEYRYGQYGNPPTGFQPGGPPVADGHGVWFTGYLANGYAQGGPAIVLYIPGSGVRMISGTGAQLAGGCN
jgi:hypothetical protein